MNEQIKDFFRPGFHLVKKLLDAQISLSDLGFCHRLQFSQYGEDGLLAGYFQDQQSGFYVDVGAYHPIRGSNTYLLHKKGWRGINIEPNPDMFPAFPRRRPSDVNLQLAVSNDQGHSQFKIDGVYSSIQPSSADGMVDVDPVAEGNLVDVETRSLVSILDQYLEPDAEIDLLTVDTEGHEITVLESNDWERFRPRVVLVEDNEPESPKLDDMMSEVCYSPLVKLGLTMVYLSDEERKNAVC